MNQLKVKTMTEARSRIGTDTSKAAKLLKAGKLVALPTETVYGLGADASSKEALSLLYKAKGRPTNHPVIVHIHDLNQLENWVLKITDEMKCLANHFWPGPLTMVLRKKETVSDQITGGQNTIAIRIPDHPLTLELLEKFNSGIAAPSANKYGRLSPTCAKDVSTEFGTEVSYILDGGNSSVGIESTIVDLSSDESMVLRPGKITRAELEEVLQKPVISHFEDPQTSHHQRNSGSSPRVPGSTKSHYAPEKPVYLVDSARLNEALEGLLNSSQKPSLLSFQELESYPNLSRVQTSLNSNDYAKNLYSNLRYLDSLDCDCILIESPPDDRSWSAIKDRLNRAARKHL